MMPANTRQIAGQGLNPNTTSMKYLQELFAKHLKMQDMRIGDEKKFLIIRINKLDIVLHSCVSDNCPLEYLPEPSEQCPVC